MFVDAGQEVDENLVNALIKEVLEERIKSMAGQRTSRDDDGVSRRGTRAPPAKRAASRDVEEKQQTTVVTSAVRKARAPSPPVVSDV